MSGSLQDLETKLFQAELAYSSLYCKKVSGLTQDDIEKMSTMKANSFMGAGAYGTGESILYKGKPYLRKTIPFTNKNSFLHEAMMIKALTANPRTRPFVPFYYGSSIEIDETGRGEGTIIMEKLIGHTMSAVLSVRGLTYEEDAQLKSQLFSMLTIFHDEGYVHRDLHSGNVFIVMKGNKLIAPVLIDFGMALHRERSKLYDYDVNTGFGTRYDNIDRAQQIFNPPKGSQRYGRSYIRNSPKNISDRIDGDYKERDYLSFHPPAEVVEELEKAYAGVEALKAQRDEVLASTAEERRQTWLASLGQHNSGLATKRRKDATIVIYQTMGDRLSSYDFSQEAKRAIMDIKEDISNFVAEAFDIMRWNGIRYYFAENRSLTMGLQAMNTFIEELAKNLQAKKPLDQAVAKAQEELTTAKDHLVSQIATLTEPTSYYGGRRRHSTRRHRKSRATRRR